MDLFQSCEYEVQAATEQWTDARVIHGDDLEDLLLFWLYVPKVLSQSGIRFHGFQLRQRDGMWLLTVKASQNGTPLVAFLTSGTTTGCIRLLISQLGRDTLRWAKDKYSWI